MTCEGCCSGKDAEGESVKELIRGAVHDLASASIQLDAVAGSLFRSGDAAKVASSGRVDAIGVQLDRFIKDLRSLGGVA